MVDFKTLIDSFLGTKVLVVGDVMIDAYLNGTVSRMSPEAPVPVVSINEEVYRLGGAANVALNLMTLGAEPIICSVIGKRKQKRFTDLLNHRNFSSEGIVISDTRKTTQKTRVIDSTKHLLRVDEEDLHDLENHDESQLINIIKSILTNQKIDVIILQDYNKGVLTDKVIDFCIQKGNSIEIPVAVDPKLKRFENYKGVTLFKPNLKEIKEGLGIDVNGGDPESVRSAMMLLEDKLQNKISFVTLSEHGVAIKSDDEFQVISAHKRNIVDVSGAGDTVISVAALCMAKGTGVKELAELSNLAGGIVCEEVGVVPIDKNRLTQEAISVINGSEVN